MFGANTYSSPKHKCDSYFDFRSSRWYLILFKISISIIIINVAILVKSFCQLFLWITQIVCNYKWFSFLLICFFRIRVVKRPIVFENDSVVVSSYFLNSCHIQSNKKHITSQPTSGPPKIHILIHISNVCMNLVHHYHVCFWSEIVISGISLIMSMGW